jgi:hypothetical protein
LEQFFLSWGFQNWTNPLPEGLAGTAWEPSKLPNYVSITPPSKTAMSLTTTPQLSSLSLSLSLSLGWLAGVSPYSPCPAPISGPYSVWECLSSLPWGALRIERNSIRTSGAHARTVCTQAMLSICETLNRLQHAGLWGLHSYLGCAGFDSHPRREPTWLRFLVLLLTFHFKLARERHSFQVGTYCATLTLAVRTLPHTGYIDCAYRSVQRYLKKHYAYGRKIWSRVQDPMIWMNIFKT